MIYHFPLVLLPLFIIFSSLSAQNWQYGDGGKVKWAFDCDFYGFDIANLSGAGEFCGSFCLADANCTHFTWYNNVCYKKRITTTINPTVVASSLATVCGFVVQSISSEPTTPSPINLVWQEEFDSFDTKRWKHLITGWRGGNSEFQFYDNRPENSYVKNGVLFIKPTLTADRFGESFLNTGPLDLGPGCNLNVEGWNCKVFPGADIINPIQSARIVTQDSFSFTYGVVEVRAKMPKGDWMWPAIWMLPTTSAYGEWPASGEIDLTEVRGNADFQCWGGPFGRQSSGTTLHWGPTAGQNQWAKTHWEKVNSNPDFSSDFHIYKMSWNANGMTFYVDGQQIGQVNPPSGGFWQLGGFSGNNIWSSGSKMAPFDKPFHFVLNVAVGGNFFAENCNNQGYNKPWAQTDSNQMKKFWAAKNSWYPTWNAGTDDNAMQVDYIRVYAPQ